MTIRCFVVSSLFLATVAFAAHAQPADKAFNLIVNGNPVGLDAGETIKLKMPDGSELTLTLERNAQVTFRGEGFSFRHLSEYQVSSSALADDLQQHLIVTGFGTLVLVQTYKGMDPTSLADFMLEQVTADDVKAGSKLDRKPAERSISGGVTIKGLMGTTISGAESAEIEVMVAKTTSGGIVAVSRIDRDNEQNDRAFVETFWSSLALD